MAESSQTTKNIHRHNTSGIIFASIILLCIAVISLVITLTALGNDEAPIKDPDTNESGNKDKNPENNEDPNGNENPGNSEDPSGNENPDNKDPGNNDPVGNSKITLENSKIYSGSLILLSESSLYQRPVEELITRSAMGKLSISKILAEYNFVSLSTGHTGDFILKDRLLYLDADTAEAFRAMMTAYATETGHKNIWLRNAYYYDSSEDIKSTADVNEALLNPHAAGLAVDIQISTESGTIPLKNAYAGYPSAEYYEWFITNCHKYGFIHTGDTNLYSTFRYVGVAHSTYMANNNLSLSDYLNAVKSKTAQDRLVISDASGKEWWVYYVKAADGESTEITVFGNLYSVSGNNSDGFVVTIDTSGL